MVDQTEWVPDEEVTKCPICSKGFSMLHNRRHHCRACGRVVCGPCSSNTLYLTNMSSQQRVCDPCFELHQHDRTASISEKLSKNRLVEASLKADLKDKHQQAEWFRYFLRRIDAEARCAGIGLHPPSEAGAELDGERAALAAHMGHLARRASGCDASTARAAARVAASATAEAAANGVSNGSTPAGGDEAGAHPSSGSSHPAPRDADAGAAGFSSLVGSRSSSRSPSPPFRSPLSSPREGLTAAGHLDDETRALAALAKRQWSGAIASLAAAAAEDEELQARVAAAKRETAQRAASAREVASRLKQMEGELKRRPQIEAERDQLRLDVAELQRELDGLTQRMAALEEDRPNVGGTSSFFSSSAARSLLGTFDRSPGEAAASSFAARTEGCRRGCAVM
eukprot:TRINITY_DN28018_c0_g1_i1.p1 TRINITY_DN28018_c0_g1~~TRINITY_DN28018_c0_g1_i1.p1  ORF type:complete len:397 (+),score=90.30 TRINITY_DN28018_c0_g1_i1:158-1348(+)